MRHELFQDNLSSYVDGTLDPAMRTAMDHHAGECPSCTAELAEMRRVFALLSSPTLDVEPPPDFHDNVMRRVRLSRREQARSPRGFFARIGWGWTAAGGLAVASLMLAVVLTVGPLGDGLTAGIGLNRAPSASVAPPTEPIDVAFANASAGRPTPVAIRVTAPTDGEWTLFARPSEGVTLRASGPPDARGEIAAWRGRLTAGETAAVALYAGLRDPRSSGSLSLRLERSDGYAVPERVFMLPAPGAARP